MKCRTCNQDTKSGDRDKQAICCDACKQYFHISCQNVDFEEFNIQKKLKNNGFKWLCTSCTMRFNEAFFRVKQMESKLDDL
ncbi:hypothetical protein B4U79_19057, partial [Dinothrombium tinctorium]